MIFERIQDASTPAEMRAAIFQLQYRDSLVSRVMRSANYSGMSAEDRYTMLAYHVLQEREVLGNLLLRHANANLLPNAHPQGVAQKPANSDDTYWFS